MIRAKWFLFSLKFLWLVGLVGLVLLRFHFEHLIRQSVQASFNVSPLFWFLPTVAIIFGAYISLLFIKGASYKINLPLFLCVTIPCLLISFYMPIAYTIVSTTTSSPNSFSVPIPFWMIKINTFEIVPIVAGLTLVMSLFGVSTKTRMNAELQTDSFVGEKSEK